jgi:hypothetical protein
MSLTATAIDHIGLKPLAERFGVRLSAVHKWKKQGLPKSELAGLTAYAQAIEELSQGKYLAADLLEETRRQWRRRTAQVIKDKRLRAEARAV